MKEKENKPKCLNGKKHEWVLKFTKFSIMGSDRVYECSICHQRYIRRNSEGKIYKIYLTKEGN
jgi:hypothetical protein